MKPCRVRKTRRAILTERGDVTRNPKYSGHKVARRRDSSQIGRISWSGGTAVKAQSRHSWELIKASELPSACRCQMSSRKKKKKKKKDAPYIPPPPTHSWWSVLWNAVKPYTNLAKYLKKNIKKICARDTYTPLITRKKKKKKKETRSEFLFV